MIKAISFKAEQPALTREIKNNNPTDEKKDKEGLSKNQKILLISSLAVLAAGGIYLASRGKGGNKLSDTAGEINKKLDKSEEKLADKLSKTVEGKNKADTPEVLKTEEKLLTEAPEASGETANNIINIENEVSPGEQKIIDNAQDVIENINPEKREVQKIDITENLDEINFSDNVREVKIDTEFETGNEIVIPARQNRKRSFKEKTAKFFRNLKETLAIKTTIQPKQNKSLSQLTEEAQKPKKVKKSLMELIKEDWAYVNQEIKNVLSNN